MVLPSSFPARNFPSAVLASLARKFRPLLSPEPRRDFEKFFAASAAENLKKLGQNPETKDFVEGRK